MTIRVFILCLPCIQLFSQGFQVSSGINYGSYQLSDIKALRSDFIRQLAATLPISVSTIGDFPPYLGFEVQVLAVQKRTNFGGFISLNSTGSRIYYADYSGSLTFDQNLKCIGVGGVFEFFPGRVGEESNKARFVLTSRVGALFSTYELDYQLSLGQSIDAELIQFNATNFIMMPGFGFRKKIRNFTIQPELRFLFDIPGSLKLSTNSDISLNKPAGGRATANWSGFRLSIAVGFEKKNK